MVESVDTRDLKSLACIGVRVQVSLWAPLELAANLAVPLPVFKNTASKTKATTLVQYLVHCSSF